MSSAARYCEGDSDAGHQRPESRSGDALNEPGPQGLLGLMRPIARLVNDSSEDSAQTSLRCLLADDAPKHSGAYFSQRSTLYRDRECRMGGWPMESTNPDVTFVTALQRHRTCQDSTDDGSWRMADNARLAERSIHGAGTERAQDLAAPAGALVEPLGYPALSRRVSSRRASHELLGRRGNGA